MSAAMAAGATERQSSIAANAKELRAEHTFISILL
jgi:hypothetical protein